MFDLALPSFNLTLLEPDAVTVAVVRQLVHNIAYGPGRLAEQESHILNGKDVLGSQQGKGFYPIKPFFQFCIHIHIVLVERGGLEPPSAAGFRILPLSYLPGLPLQASLLAWAIT